MLCDYGCGQDAITQLKNKKYCCSTNTSKCPSIKQKLKENHNGYSYNSLPEKKKINMCRKGTVEYKEEEVFIDGKEWSSEFLRKYIHHFEVFRYECSDCKLTEWKNKHITLEIDHINGKRCDNRKENLRWLCPNCHSQTDTFRGRNKNPGKRKVSDQELLTALETCSNIRQALQSVGLAAKGGNYERASRLSKKLPGW